MDRVMKDVVAPPMWPLGRDRLLDKRGVPNLQLLREHFLKEGRLTLDAASDLITRASAIIKQEPNMLELKYPITGQTTRERAERAARDSASGERERSERLGLHGSTRETRVERA